MYFVYFRGVHLAQTSRPWTFSNHIFQRDEISTCLTKCGNILTLKSNNDTHELFYNNLFCY